MLSAKGCFFEFFLFSSSFYESLAFSISSVMHKNYYPYLNTPLSLVGAISEFHLVHVVFPDSFKSKAIRKLRLFSVVKKREKLHAPAKK